MSARNLWIISTCALGLTTGALADPFYLLVTQSPPGPANTNPATWGGVLLYDVAGSGGAATPRAGISPAELSDPCGLAHNAAGEIFVSNRHGNNNPGSLSRFTFEPLTGAFTATGVISGNGLYGVHEAAFNPVDGELFAANAAGAVSRFTFDTEGQALPQGTIGAGTMRGVAVSVTGDRLYVSKAGNTIERFDLNSGLPLPTIQVPGASSLHFMAWGPEGDLYVADYYASAVFRYTFDANQEPTLHSMIGGLTGALDVAFSPDGTEMFVAGHGNGIIHRLGYDGVTDGWIPQSQLHTGVSLGGLLVVVPEPATVVLVFALAIAAARRR
ncbi:MAG: PEP-CTERM sorting domain-containing protein [Phycisphaerales bacterium]|nr:PEP-CTERM sorting domain-containing protein [Phycisphaerales bacterium]